MYIVVNHTIHNMEEFWASAQRHLPKLPEDGVKRVLKVFPNQNMDACTCVWEADSIENLDNYLRKKVGDASRETYFQINEAAALGLET
jgi:hypothetical protein